MDRDYFRIKQVLLYWNNEDNSSELSELLNSKMDDNSCERLRNALHELKFGNSKPSQADLAILIKHCISRYTAKFQKPSPLTVPKIPKFPTRETWCDFGFRIVHEEERCFSIDLTPWNPAWLGASADVNPIAEALKETERKAKIQKEDMLALTADPCVSDYFGYSNYSSNGQKTAVRRIFNSENGQTFIVTIPTGSGKSLITWLPSVAGGSIGNFSLVIVPTISLAMEQAEKIRLLLKSDSCFYWHSGLDSHQKETIKSNIRAGKQRILFTSPESINKSLKYAIYVAAKEGFLKYFIIDEAHLISSWGDEFRPEYQTLSGIWRNLFAISPEGKKFRTVLMTATLTSETLDMIIRLFTHNEEYEIISSLHLRSELSYWIYKAKNKEEKNNRIIDVLKNAPRPLLMYVSLRKDAEDWCNILRQMGFNRVEFFHANIKQEKKEEIHRNWVTNNLDIIIATSAFGVGMDKSDVRTIIHACVPENVDRYYQEAGRGGRDGKSSLSFMIYEEADINIAKQLNKKKIISIDLGYKRWEAMRAKKLYYEGDKIIIDLKADHPKIKNKRGHNIEWNLRTLILMSHAGMIQLDSIPPYEFEKRISTDDENKEIYWEEYFDSICVSLTDLDNTSEKVWREYAGRAREQIIEKNKREWNALLKLLEKEEISKLLTDTYTIPDYEIIPIPVCSGCDYCRKNNIDKSKYYMPPAQISGPVYMKYSPHTVIIKYPVPEPLRGSLVEWQSEITDIAEELINKFDIREIAYNFNFFEKSKIRSLYKKCDNGFIIYNDINLSESYDIEHLSRLSIIEPKYPPETLPETLLSLKRSLHLILFPDNTKHYEPTKKFLIETAIFNSINTILME